MSRQAKLSLITDSAEETARAAKRQKTRAKASEAKKQAKADLKKTLTDARSSSKKGIKATTGDVYHTTHKSLASIPPADLYGRRNYPKANLSHSTQACQSKVPKREMIWFHCH